MSISSNIRSIDFSSRLSVRAITAGIVVTYALMILVMSLAAGLGLWTYQLRELPNLGTGFWAFAFASWIGTIYLGSYVAVLASRSATRRDGILNGVVTWAGACVIGCGLLGVASEGAFSSLRGQSSFWAAFCTGLLALGASVLAGTLASGSEAEVSRKERKLPDAEVTRLPRAVGML